MSYPSILNDANPVLVKIFQGLDAQKGGNQIPPLLQSAPSDDDLFPAVPLANAVSPRYGPQPSIPFGAPAVSGGRDVRAPGPTPMRDAPATMAQAPAPARDPGSAPADAPGLGQVIAQLVANSQGQGPQTTGAVQPSTPAAAPTPSLRDQAAAMYAQAQGIPNAPPPHLSFGFADALALGGSLLAGRQGGNVLGGFLQGKEQGASQNAAYQQADADRRRQALTGQAQGLTKAADTQDLIGGRSDVNAAKIAGNLEGLDIKGDTARDVAAIRGQFSLDNAKVRARATLDVANLASQNKDFAALLKQTQSDVPEERALALQSLRTNFPKYYGSATDAQIDASRQATDDELLKRAKASESVNAGKRDLAAAGYSSALTQKTLALLPTDIEGARTLIALHQKQADKVGAEITKTLADSGLDEARAQQIRVQTDHIDPDMRQKWALNGARIAQITQKIQDAQNGGGSVGKNEARDLRAAYQVQANIAKQQIDRITSKGKGKPPTPLLPDGTDNPDYTPYVVAVKAQGDALRGIAGVTKATTSVPVVNPLTQGRLPSNPNQGGDTVLAGGAYGGNSATARGMKNSPPVFGLSPYDEIERKYLQQAQDALASGKYDQATLQRLVAQNIQAHRKARGYVK